MNKINFRNYMNTETNLSKSSIDAYVSAIFGNENKNTPAAKKHYNKFLLKEAKESINVVSVHEKHKRDFLDRSYIVIFNKEGHEYGATVTFSGDGEGNHHIYVKLIGESVFGDLSLSEKTIIKDAAGFGWASFSSTGSRPYRKYGAGR